MQIGKLTCALPCFSDPKVVETDFSLVLRVSIVVLGLLCFIASFFIFDYISGSEGIAGGSSLMAVGISIGLVAFCIRCVESKVNRYNRIHNSHDPSDSNPILPKDTESALSNQYPVTIEFPQNLLDNPLSVDLLQLLFCSYFNSDHWIPLMKVSKTLCTFMRSNCFWSRFLVHENNRIWGATSVFIDNYPSTNKLEHVNDAFYQLKAYHELRKKDFYDKYLDYFIRLMPGGPIAFQAIPFEKLEKNMDDACTHFKNLNPESMSAPLVLSQTHDLFIFALRLEITEDRQTRLISLIFVRNPLYFFWGSINKSWPGNMQLSLNSDQDYVLALIRGEEITHERFPDPKYIKNLKLV